MNALHILYYLLQFDGGSHLTLFSNFIIHALITCVILRFTSGATPAYCIGVSMAAKLLPSMYLQMRLQALVEVRGSNPQPPVLHTTSTAL